MENELPPGKEENQGESQQVESVGAGDLGKEGTIIHPLEETVEIQKNKGEAEKKLWPTVAIVVAIVAAGVGSGWRLAQAREGETVRLTTDGEVVISKEGKVEKAGVEDEQTFRDQAEGVLEVNDGSATNEGTHMLIRPGGQSQTVYLISSIVDLNQFVGRRVQVWGETFDSQTAGWLMDVGLVKTLED